MWVVSYDEMVFGVVKYSDENIVCVLGVVSFFLFVYVYSELLFMICVQGIF